MLTYRRFLSGADNFQRGRDSNPQSYVPKSDALSIASLDYLRVRKDPLNQIHDASEASREIARTGLIL